MQEDVRRQLSEALGSVSKRYAQLVLDPMTEIEAYPAPFLMRSAIYRVEHFVPPGFTLFYVGFAPKKHAYLLTGAPENLARLARADAVAIDTPEMAISYATAYLEVTRSMSKLFYLVKSVDGIEFRPNLDAEATAVKTSVTERYRPVIVPPAAEATASGYAVTVYAVREQALERHVVTVRRNGEVQSDITILEQGLPLVYGL